MKNLILAVAVALTTVGSAYAAEIEGIIASIDHEARIVVLDDGTELMIAESVEHGDLSKGQSVLFVTDDTSGDVIDLAIIQ